MKFEITINYSNVPDTKPWTEVYSKPEINSLAEAREWAEDTLRDFNATERMRHKEKARLRTLVDVCLLEMDDDQHHWMKKNLVTIMDASGGSYDAMECKRCGCTGRRYGLGDRVTRDKKWKHPKFETCSGRR